MAKPSSFTRTLASLDFQVRVRQSASSRLLTLSRSDSRSPLASSSRRPLSCSSRRIPVVGSIKSAYTPLRTPTFASTFATPSQTPCSEAPRRSLSSSSSSGSPPKRTSWSKSDAPRKGNRQLTPAGPASVPAHVPRSIVSSLPSAIGQREVVYRPEDVARMSQQYRKLRGIRDFDKLVPKFMQQKRFEEQQKALGIEGTKRQLRKMGPSAVNAREFRLTGKRGMPDLRRCVPEDWEEEDEESQSNWVQPQTSATSASSAQSWTPDSPFILTLGGEEDDATFESSQESSQDAHRPQKRPSIPLTVRFTTHHGCETQARDAKAINVPMPPMSEALHPGLPPSFLPTPDKLLLSLQRPLLTVKAAPQVTNSGVHSCQPQTAIHQRRVLETSKAYVEEVLRLMEAENDPKLSQLGAILMRKNMEKLDPIRGVRRKSDPNQVNLEGVNHVPEGNKVLSVGVFVPVGIKMTHKGACVRSKVKRRTLHALRNALKKDFAEKGGTDKAVKDWQHWIFYINPNPMVKLLPMDQLIDIMHGALKEIRARQSNQPRSDRTLLQLEGPGNPYKSQKKSNKKQKRVDRVDERKKQSDGGLQLQKEVRFWSGMIAKSSVKPWRKSEKPP